MINGRLVKELWELTGIGVGKCRQALEKEGTIEGAINYFRKIGDEPNIKGLSECRVDLLDRGSGKVVDTFKSISELESKIPDFYFKYSVRIVSNVGHYSYLK